MPPTFLLTRLFDDLEGSRGYSWPKKGKLAEAQQGAEETLIKQAFDLRKGSVRLKAAVVQVPLLPAPVRAAPLVITAGAADSPSDWLKDALWCERVGAAFEGRRAATSCSDGERAELLMRLVSPRLDRHIQQRVDPKKHDSWVFRYVRENLAALAAIAVRFGHAVLDLACASMDSPLLRDDCHFVEAAGPRAFILQGCYVTWDDVRKRWVRSGDREPAEKRRYTRGGACGRVETCNDSGPFVPVLHVVPRRKQPTQHRRAAPRLP